MIEGQKKCITVARIFFQLKIKPEELYQIKFIKGNHFHITSDQQNHFIQRYPARKLIHKTNGNIVDLNEGPDVLSVHSCLSLSRNFSENI